MHLLDRLFERLKRSIAVLAIFLLVLVLGGRLISGVAQGLHLHVFDAVLRACVLDSDSGESWGIRRNADNQRLRDVMIGMTIEEEPTIE